VLSVIIYQDFIGRWSLRVCPPGLLQFLPFYNGPFITSGGRLTFLLPWFWCCFFLARSYMKRARQDLMRFCIRKMYPFPHSFRFGLFSRAKGVSVSPRPPAEMSRSFSRVFQPPPDAQRFKGMGVLPKPLSPPFRNLFVPFGFEPPFCHTSR